MDKIEKIRQEIERLKSQLVRGACAAQVCMETNCKEEAYNEVLSFIDSLQDEPISDDLVEAAEEYTDGINWAKENYITPYIRLSFKAGANWQKEKFEKNRLDACDKITKEEYDLETALLDKYIKEYNRLPMFADAIKFGMELQKERDHDACLSCEKSRDVVFYNGEKYAIEQMKKEAVEGTVCKQRDSSQATWIELAPNSLPAFDDCELVKCIILKDE